MGENDIYRSIKNYNLLKRSSFHTPGHKGNGFLNQKLKLEIDVTELPSTDDLYDPKLCIRLSENKATEFYGTKKTVFSAGGNTLCVQTMLKLICNEKINHIIFSRNVHKSVVSAMALLNIVPHWVVPKSHVGGEFSCYISPEEIFKLLEKNKNIKAVFITSPDYFGNIFNVEEISKVCKEFDVPLLVDNAHGSHLVCINKNMHPISQGASLVADSIHKTLPSLTGSALLHIMDERFIPCAKKSMGMFGSTSPSFLILSSIDVCIDWMINNGNFEFKKFLKKVESIKTVADKKGILLKSESSDPARMTLDILKSGYQKSEFMEYLYKCGIEPEYCGDCYFIFIFSPFNTDEDFSRLKFALSNLQTKKIAFEKIMPDFNFSIPQNTVCTVRDAMFSNSKLVSVKESVGKCVSEIIAPCPPGMPLLIPGEVIREKEQALLTAYGIEKVNVVE